MSDARKPLAATNAPNAADPPSSASSVRFAKDTSSSGTGSSKSRISNSSSAVPAAANPNKVNGMPSFSVMSSGMPSSILAEELILRGSKKKPVAGQTINGFFNTITHLHLSGCKLIDDVAAVTICSNLRVLYLYENRLTSLGGLVGLERLTHLYAQDNRIESLDDFECPPNLLQLHLGGNRLSEISGLHTCTCLDELHLNGQTPPAAAPPTPDENEADAVELEDEAATKKDATPAAAAAPPAALALPRLTIAPESLMAIAPTLQKLVVSSCHLDDDGLEPVVVLQRLVSLNVRHNHLESLGRLQQLLLRLPCLQSLDLEGNPLVDSPKLRERLIVASESLASVDDKPIKANERAFVMTLAMRQASASMSKSASRASSAAPSDAPLDDASGGGGSYGGGTRKIPSHRGRPQQLGVSIPSATSFDLGRRAGLVLGEPPAGFYEDAHQPKSTALMSGARRPWSRPNVPHMA